MPAEPPSTIAEALEQALRAVHAEVGPDVWERADALRKLTRRTPAEQEELYALRARWGLRLQSALFAWPDLDAALQRYLVRYALVEVLHQPPEEVWPALREVFGEGNDHAPVGGEEQDPGVPGLVEPRAGLPYLPATLDLAFEAHAFLEDCGPWGTTVLDRPDRPLGLLRVVYARRLVDVLRSRYGRAVVGPEGTAEEAAEPPQVGPKAEPDPSRKGARARTGDWRVRVRPDEKAHHETAALLELLWHIQGSAAGLLGPAGTALTSCYDDAIALIWARLEANQGKNPSAVLATLIRKLLPTDVLSPDPERAPRCMPLTAGAEHCVTGAWSGPDWKDAWPESAEALAETLDRPDRPLPPPQTPAAGLSLLARLLAEDNDRASVVQAGLLARRLIPAALQDPDREARERARNAVESTIRLQHARYARAVREHFERSLDLVEDRLDSLPEHGP